MNKEGTEENFLRAKNTAVYESNNMVTDVQSGEILYQEKSTKVKTSTEPDFIKVYYKAMMAVNAISEIPLDFLLALSAQIGFTNGDKIMFYNNKTTRRAISEYCNIGDNMTAKYIKRAVEKGILFSTQDRGSYEVNPWLIAKGKWDLDNGLAHADTAVLYKAGLMQLLREEQHKASLAQCTGHYALAGLKAAVPGKLPDLRAGQIGVAPALAAGKIYL